MSSESTKSEQKTIRFNVGGQLYEVSKSLIEQREDTMLARLVSDTWLADPNSTIFIDRDGERFKYVVDYLRYGKVSLPLTVPREMFFLDMGFYGFTSVDNDAVRSADLEKRLEISLESLVVERVMDYSHRYFTKDAYESGEHERASVYLNGKMVVNVKKSMKNGVWSLLIDTK